MQLNAAARALVVRVLTAGRAWLCSCTRRAEQPSAADSGARLPELAAGGRSMGAVLVMVCLVVALMAAVGAAQSPPDVRTETERLKVRVLELQTQLARAIADADACRAEIGPVRAQLNARIVAEQTAATAKELEGAHPGTRFNPSTGLLDAVPPPSKSTP